MGICLLRYNDREKGDSETKVKIGTSAEKMGFQMLCMSSSGGVGETFTGTLWLHLNTLLNTQSRLQHGPSTDQLSMC